MRRPSGMTSFVQSGLPPGAIHAGHPEHSIRDGRRGDIRAKCGTTPSNRSPYCPKIRPRRFAFDSICAFVQPVVAFASISTT